jgi:hypothetical protein
MRRAAWALVMVAGFAAAPSLLAQPTPPPQQPARAAAEANDVSLPITRITLYRSGVAAMQRRGLVDGDARVQLRFTTEQINDILKSMVVLDLSKGQGQVDGVSYASREPLAKRLSSFGIDLSNYPSMADLLGRLRGARVAIERPGDRIVGTIIGGEVRCEAVGDAAELVQVPYLNVLTDSGLRAVNLNQATSTQLLDKDLQDELAKALLALAEHRADRTKTVDVSLSGTGAREVAIAYVQESPVWKASYRLVLPDAPAKGKDAQSPAEAAPESAVMQGWAIVENTTDEDWQNVRLSLVSGRPVSFTMDLYEPLFMARPSVPVPTIAGVMSRAYEAGDDPRAGGMPGGARARRPSSRGEGGPADGSGGMPPTASAAPAMAFDRMMEPGSPGAPPAGERYGLGLSGDDLSDYGAKAQAQGVSTGEVFQYELERPVTIERQRSAMLPILAAPVEATRVSIFNLNEDAVNPMRGVRIRNSGDNQLMPGPIAVYDGGTYAGDAQIGHVAAGDSRLLAYALDLDVVASTDAQYSEAFQSLKFVNGVCEMTFQIETTNRVSFSNKDESRPRRIIVETSKQPGFDLIEPQKPSEVTPGAERFDVDVPAGGTSELKIVRRQVTARTISVMSLDADTLVSYSRQGRVSKAVMDAFAQLTSLRDRSAAATRTIQGFEQQRAEIDAEQARIRANISAIDRSSELYNQYMARLTAHEAELQRIRDSLTRTRAELDAANNEIVAFVRTLNVD